MREFRVYSKRTNLRVGSSVKLDDFEAEHLRKSLRVKKNDEIIIFNGEKEFKATLTLVSNDAVMAEIHSTITSEQDTAKKIDLYQALNKSKSFELTIEKATEIGVSSIFPLETEYSIIKTDDISDKKIDRWQKIIISACKQSERISVPTLESPITLTEIQSSLQDYDLILFLSTETVSNAKNISDISDKIQEAKSIAVIVGPEGGFSPTEVELITQIDKLIPVSINKNILRSETAAIVVLGYLLVWVWVGFDATKIKLIPKFKFPLSL